jgi:hypothetical protein
MPFDSSVSPWPTIELPSVCSDGKYRLNVLGASVADVVSSVGGWLCDLAFAGWVIRVVLRDIDDTRALRIIGVDRDPLNLDSYMPGSTRPEGLLAVSAQLAIEDGGVCPPLAKAMRTSAQTLMWGIATSMVSSAPSAYRPSAAALAFKKQALSAAHISVTTFEEREILVLTPGGEFSNAS